MRGSFLIGASVLFLATPALADGDAAAGRTKARMCQTCHGLDGLARQPDAANIGGESAVYLSNQLTAFRSGTRKHEQMSVIASTLTDQDIADLVAWFSSVKITVELPD